MPKNKPRRLWLKIKFDAPGATRTEVLRKLLDSIRRRDYEYPQSWRVALGWSNKENGMLKWGEFTQEMTNSAQSSSGFDMAVKSYLENQL